MTIVKAAAIEISTTLNSCERTVQKVVRNIVQVGKLRVQFATFPLTQGHSR
jgi:nitrilase